MCLPGRVACGRRARPHGRLPHCVGQTEHAAGRLSPGAAAIELFRQGLKYTVNDWYGKVKGFDRQQGPFLDFKGKTEHYIRPVSHMAFALAVALRFNVYDENVTGVAADRARDMAVRLVSSLAYRHKATLGEREGWGNQWQSAWWAQQRRLPPGCCGTSWTKPRKRGGRHDSYEADRFMNYDIPYYKDRTGKVVYEGDSKSEENAWNSDLLVLAALMFPQHPHAAVWHRRAVELQLSAYASPSDLTSRKRINGIRLRDF